MKDEYIIVDDLETIQKLLYYILGQLHKICDENGLIYNLYGGTLLGAVRHNAMIPWDDDIDVSMPRRDCIKLKKIILEKFSDKLVLLCPGDINYVYPYYKLCLKDTIIVEHDLEDKYSESKLFIDVFPVDGFLKSDENTECIIERKLKKLKEKRSYCVIKIKPSKRIWKKPYYIIRMIKKKAFLLKGFKYYLNEEIDFSQKYSFDECELVYVAAASWFNKGVMKKSEYIERELVPFGDLKCWIPKGYDVWLKNVYSEYLVLPPAEKRIASHNYTLKVHKEVLKWL